MPAGSRRLPRRLHSSGGDRGLPGVGQERERDLLDLRLDLEDADLDLLVGLDDVGDAAHPGRRELRDVDQSLDAGLELDERAEVHESG